MNTKRMIKAVLAVVLALSILMGLRGVPGLSGMTARAEQPDIIIKANLSDCTDEITAEEPNRTVLQVINNTLYKWHEFDRPDGTLSISLEKPYISNLKEGEARELLALSASWKSQVPKQLNQQTGIYLEPADADIRLPMVDNEFFAQRLEDDMVRYKSAAGNGTGNTEGESPLYQSTIYEDVTEWESNNTMGLADIIDSSYYGEPGYRITADIDSSNSDVDYFRVDFAVGGVLSFYGWWWENYKDQNREADLVITLYDSNGFLIGESSYHSSGDGTGTALLPDTQVYAETCFVRITVNGSAVTDYTGENYLVEMHFDSYFNEIPTEVADTTIYPYYTSGYVSTEFSGSYYRGSANLVTPYTALTVAHNIYDVDTNTYVNTFDFSPGQYVNGSRQYPYGTKRAVQTEINPQYIADNNNGTYADDFNNDYGAAHFSTPFTGITTFMPVVFNHMPDDVYMTGYPAYIMNENVYGQYETDGYVNTDLSDGYSLVWDMYAYGGNSGSMVWDYNTDAGTERIIGALAFGSSTYTGGPWFSDNNIAFIEDWMSWAPAGESGISGYIELEGKDGLPSGAVEVVIDMQDSSVQYMVNANSDGSFIFTGINSGTYDMSITMSGYLGRTITDISVNNQMLLLASRDEPVALNAGDFDGLTGVDAGDLAYAMSLSGYTDADPEYDAYADFNNDGVIDSGDIDIVKVNVGMQTTDY
ncbi:MAG: carboxypeptidase regulatory-like domain-containing protein [Clostridia bacterium]|nr:carboxypeptidase regulatory-like domain-containing protein [Clostridia bacterium]